MKKKTVKHIKALETKLELTESLVISFRKSQDKLLKDIDKCIAKSIELQESLSKANLRIFELQQSAR